MAVPIRMELGERTRMRWKAETVGETCAQCQTELFALLQVLESVAGHETAEPEILGVALAAFLVNLHALGQAVEDTEAVEVAVPQICEQDATT